MASQDITSKMQLYPENARTSASTIRQLVHSTAESEQLGPVRESLKWGEPSFTVENGSPFRMDWKESTPDTFYIFFNCQTSLIATFRELYGSMLRFDGSRAIVLNLNEEIPENILCHCFSLAMRYHSIKHLPLLGA